MEKVKKIKKLTGMALRDVKEKTVLIKVMLTKIHPLYKKRYSTSRKYLAHAEMEVKKGQKVVISETKPISKRKTWKVLEVKE